MSDETSGGTLKVVLIVIGAVALLLVLICVVSSFLGAGAILVPRIQAKQAQTACANHLRQLGAVYVVDTMERPDAAPRHGGPALFVHYVQSGVIALKDTPLLLCPADESAADPAAPGYAARFAAADLAQVPRDLCSYAVHDFAAFPVDLDTVDERQPLAACPHHRDGVNVLFFDGSVHFWDWFDLDLPRGTPVVFGPDSAIAEFAQLRSHE